MKTWLARRFKYTRDLERWLGETENEVKAVARDADVAADERERTIHKLRWGTMELPDAVTALTALVDYHRILNREVMPDPVEPRIRHLFDKYDIKVDPPLDFLPRRG